MQQTFSAGKESKIIIRDVSGDLSVQTWDQASISVESDGQVVRRLFHECG